MYNQTSTAYLPYTGLAVASYLIWGFTLIMAGVAILATVHILAYRRRRAREEAVLNGQQGPIEL